MIDFDIFRKIAYECGRLVQINCCQRLEKVTQSPINCPIWSHCLKWKYLNCKRALVTEPSMTQHLFFNKNHFWFRPRLLYFTKIIPNCLCLESKSPKMWCPSLAYTLCGTTITLSAEGSRCGVGRMATAFAFKSDDPYLVTSLTCPLTN